MESPEQDLPQDSSANPAGNTPSSPSMDTAMTSSSDIPSQANTIPTDNTMMPPAETPASNSFASEPMYSPVSTQPAMHPNDMMMAPEPDHVPNSDLMNASSTATPPLPPKRDTRLPILLVITGLLLLALGGAVWFFFLRGDNETATPTPTPTASQAITPTKGASAGNASGETHLECRFGLCVEVPGPGVNACSSSFDCSSTGSTSPTPTQVASAATVAPSATPTKTAVGAPVATTAPTGTRTPTPTRTVTPTPLATQLPESGTTETTMIFLFLIIALLGSGITLAYRKN